MESLGSNGGPCFSRLGSQQQARTIHRKWQSQGKTLRSFGALLHEFLQKVITSRHQLQIWLLVRVVGVANLKTTELLWCSVSTHSSVAKVQEQDLTAFDLSSRKYSRIGNWKPAMKQQGI